MNVRQPAIHSRGLIRVAIAFLLALCLRPAPAAIPDLSLGEGWQDSVATLERLPVQDTGYIRTGYSFSENLLGAISGRRDVGGVGALEVLLRLVRNHDEAVEAPLIKISHPDLVKIYGAARISAAQWRDQQYREKLMAYLALDQENRMDSLNSIEYRAQLIENLEGEFAIVPRAGEWLSPEAARKAQDLSPAESAIIAQWDALLVALRSNDPKAGGDASRALVEAVTKTAAEVEDRLPALDLEYFYHTHKPFRNAAVFYLFAALFYGAGMVLGRGRLAWVGLGLLVLGFVEHVTGLTIRWILAERGPLSNMYESFVFAIGGMVLVALVLEFSRTVRLTGLGASILGFIFMVIAHKAPIFDSQIRPLMPALQSSWLTYHVVTIMLSYSAFALSFFVSALYLTKDLLLGGDAGAGFLARRLPSLRAMDIFNYRIIAIGFPLLSLGIIAGAIWAATAWGRPWGFDPKETWSAITWLIYAIYLHLRYMAGWSNRSTAIVSLVGFLCVLFTYLGVNYLLSGLHSYV